jgi:cobalt/nickel transport system permease protein
MSVHALHATGVAGDPASPIHRLDPRAKIVGFAAITLVGVSTPPRLWPVLAACAVALAAIAMAGHVGPRLVWSRARVVLPLVVFVAVFVPFVRGGERVDVGPLSLSEDGLTTFASVASKAAIGTVSAVLLGATTSFPDVLHGLERMRAPRLLVLIAAFMYRYLFVIADEARRMRVALAARGYRPRHALQAAAIGRVAISLFLRTYDRAERVYVAMLSRGYAGSTPRLNALVFGRADALFLAAVGGALLPLRVLVEMAS